MTRTVWLRWALALTAALTVGCLVFLVVLRPSPLPTGETPTDQLPQDFSARCDPTLATDTWVSCVQDVLFAMADAQGAESVVRAIDALISDDPDRFGPYCHAVSHNVGDHLGALAPASNLTERAPYSCYGGFWHGYLSQRGDMLEPFDYVREVDGLCDPVVARNAPAIELFDCVHGVGHGLGMLRDLDIQQAFSACRDLFVRESEVYDCGTGVSSAYATRSLTASGLLPFDHGAPPGPDAEFPAVTTACDALNDIGLLRACWERMAAFAEAAGANLKALAAECADASLPDACARSVGLRFGAALTPQDAQEAWQQCRVFPDGLIRACLDGVLWNTAPVEVTTRQQFAACSVWPDPYRPWCQETAQGYRETEMGPSRDLT